MRYIIAFTFIYIATFVGAQYSSTPLMLSLPMDGDTIQESEPLFVWQTTLTDLGSDPRLNLVLNVVQLDDDQTPTEGILENSPVFTRQNLLSSSINFSEIDHQLVEGRWYAWQVVLFFNEIQVQQSEVYRFIKATPEEPVTPYFKLRTKVDNSFIELYGDVLYVSTDEHGDFQLKAVISGTKISPQTIVFEETNLTSNEQSIKSVHQIESRYFKCDLSSLDLDKGKYRINWEANTTKQFTFFVKIK